MLLGAFFMALHALQTDEELAMQSLFQAKHGLNRATHAAAQQTDQEEIAGGVADLDPEAARRTALAYLRGNLQLDESLKPLPGSFLQTPVEIIALDVIGADRSFPYIYQQPLYGYSVTFNRPGVAMLIRLQYPRMYQVMSPVTWIIKSSAELVF